MLPKRDPPGVNSIIAMNAANYINKNLIFLDSKFAASRYKVFRGSYIKRSNIMGNVSVAILYRAIFPNLYRWQETGGYRRFDFLATNFV